MKNFTILLLIVMVGVFAYSNIYAQGKERSIVKGWVLDNDTGNPLEAASIYFAQTTIGAIADKRGQFSLDVTKAGNYELVVSMVGYELQKKSIFVESGQNYDFQFKLVPKTLEVETMEVVGEDQVEWKMNKEIFKRRLLGDLASASDCTVKNLEFVNFKRDGSVITATSSKPIIITSPYLGYEIVVEMSSFYYNRGSNMLEYTFLPKYNELKAESQVQKDEWETNRANTYFGSPEHFLWALKNETIATEGFVVFPTYSLNLRLQRYEGETIIQSWKDLRSKDQIDNDEALTFRGYLKIIYKGTYVSCIKLKYPSFTIDEYGRTDNHLPFECAGFWAKYGVASRLPLDYLPASIKTVVTKKL